MPTTAVQLDNDKEISAYAVYVMTQAGCQEIHRFAYNDRHDQGAAFAAAYKTAHNLATLHRTTVESNW